MISIVDDDEAARSALQRLVKSIGYDSKVFASAQEFLDSPQVNEALCLITDVHMPRMDGVELAIPDERIRALALEAGAIAFLNKPIEERVLIKHIEIALRPRDE